MGQERKLKNIEKEDKKGREKDWKEIRNRKCIHVMESRLCTTVPVYQKKIKF